MRQMDQFSLTKSLHADFFNSAVLKGICRGTMLQSMEGFILSNWSWTRPGTVPAAKEPRVLITPIKPDMVSAWPTQDLAVPIMRGFSGLQESDPVSKKTITSTYSAFCCEILSTINGSTHSNEILDAILSTKLFIGIQHLARRNKFIDSKLTQA